jgi:peptidyl-prolyl cis-trans isomerase C
MIVLLLLVGGLLFDRVLTPNQTLATVGSASISRQEYWKVRAYDLYEQALQFQDFSRFVGPDQQGQYVAMAQQSLAQIPNVWGGRDVDPATLQKMIDDQIYLQGLDDLGLAVTPDEIETFALNRFAPPGAPLIPPTVPPTLTAERSAFATSTAVASLATPIASPAASTPREGTPKAELPVATPANGTSATPGPADARATAEAEFTRFENQFFPQARLSRDEYERLIAAPGLARQKVRDALAASIGQSAPQVHAAHILLPTQEDAEAARRRVVDEAEQFATVAIELSTDAATAPSGGDLGWFTREEMVAPFADAAFSLEPGSISEPIESDFGWHIIRIEESDPDRPLSDQQINRLQQEAVEQWLGEQRATHPVSSSLPPTPTPIAEQFTAPLGAPQPPPAMEVEHMSQPSPLPATPEA